MSPIQDIPIEEQRAQLRGRIEELASRGHRPRDHFNQDDLMFAFAGDEDDLEAVDQHAIVRRDDKRITRESRREMREMTALVLAEFKAEEERKLLERARVEAARRLSVQYAENDE